MSKQDRRSISVRGSAYRRVRDYCQGRSLSMSDFVEQRIAEFFAQMPERETTVARTLATVVEQSVKQDLFVGAEPDSVAASLKANGRKGSATDERTISVVDAVPKGTERSMGIFPVAATIIAPPASPVAPAVERRRAKPPGARGAPAGPSQRRFNAATAVQIAARKAPEPPGPRFPPQKDPANLRRAERDGRGAVATAPKTANPAPAQPPIVAADKPAQMPAPPRRREHHREVVYTGALPPVPPTPEGRRVDVPDRVPPPLEGGALDWRRVGF